MTEEQIERFAERKMDALDRRLMAGAITQTEYDACVKALDWDCKDLYRIHVAPIPSYSRY